MGRFNELDIDRATDESFADFGDDFPDLPTNEVSFPTEIEELKLQIQASLMDLSEASKSLEGLIFRWKYYEEKPRPEDLERILIYINTARRTIA